MPASHREPAFLHFLLELIQHLERVREADKALKLGMRMARDYCGADAACVGFLPPGKDTAEVGFLLPRRRSWDPDLLTAFLRDRKTALPGTVCIVPIERRGRSWGALALERSGRAFDGHERRSLRLVAHQISKFIGRIDRQRSADVRARIDRKLIEQLRPQDLFYQILHGLRSLTRYDHSAALLIHQEGADALEVVAEQIAWRKAKSARIGHVLPLSEDVRAQMESGEVVGFDRVDGCWRERDGRPLAAVAELLDYNRAAEPDAGEEEERSILCAPLATREGMLGVLKVASCHAGTLGEYEVDLIRRFLPYAAIAIRNLRRQESLELGILEAEKKHVMANLARGVAHDINNAFGAALPLVQQARAEVESGDFSAEVLAADLAQVEASLQVCRRIFAGMLSFAKGAARGGGSADVNRAIESAVGILGRTMEHQDVTLDLELTDDLPAVRAAQGDLEQLTLNLATNALEAMPRGGVLRIASSLADDGVQLVVRDTGAGIAPELLARIEEPFFTTKRAGNGLGLSICRSIVWAIGGKLHFESPSGEGTRVRVALPAIDAGAERHE